MNDLLKLMSIMLIPLLFSGCAAIVAGGAAAGGAIWYRGELRENLPGSVEQVCKAADRSMKNFKFTIKDSKSDKLRGEINVEMADGTDVKISVRSQGDKVSEIRIRVGIMGDEKVSRQIIEDIKKVLLMAETLMCDEDLYVQKGVGWLLKAASKVYPNDAQLVWFRFSFACR